jgi:hypothetical protein
VFINQIIGYSPIIPGWQLGWDQENSMLLGIKKGYQRNDI